jgi:hypothetical protein
MLTQQLESSIPRFGDRSRGAAGERVLFGWGDSC